MAERSDRVTDLFRQWCYGRQNGIADKSIFLAVNIMDFSRDLTVG
jgi:hypothetical protein